MSNEFKQLFKEASSESEAGKILGIKLGNRYPRLKDYAGLPVTGVKGPVLNNVYKLLVRRHRIPFHPFRIYIKDEKKGELWKNKVTVEIRRKYQAGVTEWQRRKVHEVTKKEYNRAIWIAKKDRPDLTKVGVLLAFGKEEEVEDRIDESDKEMVEKLGGE